MMKDEIIEELWKAKDEVAGKYGYNIQILVKKLKENEEKEDEPIFDFTKKKIPSK